jgi:hypothetical protein
MANSFEILESRKVGLNSKDAYIVTRGRVSYLRVLGGEPEWELMTATASEDTGGVKVCSEQRRLVEAALRLGAELDTGPQVEKDWMGREYVKICVIKTHPGDDAKEVRKEIDKALTRYFELYDAYESPDSRPRDEMQELYGVLAIDDVGSDVYLSDGVWLSSDGSIHDRGR